MLTIQEHQLAVFRGRSGGNFDDHLVEHLRRFTPDQAKALGEAGLRRVIRYGMERADNHGFTKRGPSRFYVEVMFMLGSDFDTDPQYPWAFEVLSNPAIGDEIARADALHARLMQYVKATATPGMLRSAMELALASLNHSGPMQDERLKDILIAWAQRVYPQKFAFVGEKALRVLVEDTYRRGEFFGLNDGPGILLLFGLAYSAGHGFAFDPQYPWIASSLEILDPAERYQRLASRSRAYLASVIANFDRRG